VNVSCWNALLNCLGAFVGLLHERTMVSIGFLAQASTSRLGETNGGSPKFPTRVVA